MRYASSCSLSHCERIAGAIALGIAFLFFAGCQKPEEPTVATRAELSPDEDLDQLWFTALTVLRKVDFQPDRQDRANGVISCFPTTSKQWHEPWRQDVATGYGLLESSIHTIQRQATVKFINDGHWMIDVQVDVYRLAKSETQITTASSVLHGFADRLPTDDGMAADSKLVASQHWVPIGRDGPLEERLLNRILNEAGATTIQSESTEAHEG